MARCSVTCRAIYIQIYNIQYMFICFYRVKLQHALVTFLSAVHVIFSCRQLSGGGDSTLMTA